MKPTINLLQTVFWLLSTMLVSGADQSGKDPEVPAMLVAKTVAWQIHWDHRAGMASRAPSMLTFKINTNSEVWVDGLKWIISFDDRNGELFPFNVDHAPEYIKRDAALPFARLAKVTVKLPAYTNSFHKISAVKADSREKLLGAFKRETCDDKMLEFYKNQTGQPIKKVRFWIAPVDLDFPVLLYTVEGVQYVGKVYFGTHSSKPLYSECNYITEPGSDAHDQGLKLINAIKAEGTAFDLKNGQLVPVAGSSGKLGSEQWGMIE